MESHDSEFARGGGYGLPAAPAPAGPHAHLYRAEDGEPGDRTIAILVRPRDHEPERVYWRADSIAGETGYEVGDGERWYEVAGAPIDDEPLTWDLLTLHDGPIFLVDLP